jgi:anti-sigma factor RsiW
LFPPRSAEFDVVTTPSFSESDLEAFLDEALPSEEMARIERALRMEPALMHRMAAINGRRDAGVHSVGAIWRRHRLSCPAREQLGNFMLGILPQEMADYVRFHLETVGCRWCQANRSDLARQQAAINLRSVPEAAVQSRRRKYFQSSAGYLRKGKN